MAKEFALSAKSLSRNYTLPQRKNYVLALLFLTIFFLLPIYKFSRGGFQYVDIPIVIIAILIFFKHYKINNYIINIWILLLPFVIWTLLINTIYFININDVFVLFAAVSIIYGFVLMLIFTKIYSLLLENNGFIYIYVGMLLSLMACLLIRGNPDYSFSDARSTLSFSNPNQLAYYSVILLSYLILMQNYRINHNISNLMYVASDIFIFCVAHIFLILCASRSGIITALVLDICYLKNLKDKKVFISIGIAVAILVIFATFINPDLIIRQWKLRQHQSDMVHGRDGMVDRVLKPLEDMRGLDFLIGRRGSIALGVVDSKSSLTKRESSIEVHNLFGDILKCYGIIGLFLFVVWMFKMLKISTNIKDGLWILSSLMLYNMAGNGIRFRFFWIFLAFFLALINQAYNQKIKHGQT